MSTIHTYPTDFDEENGQTISATNCPECAGWLRTEGVEIGCIECGLIVNEYWIDHGPEHRSFDAGAGRTGVPLTAARHNRGLSTEIGFGRDGKGNRLSPRKRRQLVGLRTQHNRGRWRSKGERNLAHAFSEIARLVSALELPRSVREEAATIYRRAKSENLVLGRSIETIAAGSVYATCRCGGYVRTIEEVAEEARFDRRKVRLDYQVVNVELGLESLPLWPSDVLPRLASEFEVASGVQRRALELTELAETVGIANGRNPAGVAAACLYLVGWEQGVALTQEALAE